jgi:hypothetical protein
MELTASELKQLVSIDAAETPRDVETKFGLQIVVLDRGWVVIGECEFLGDILHIHNSAVIRRWGTTEGLGQLAREGKQRETVLDESGLVRAPRRAIVMMLQCEPSKWKR